MLKLLKGHTIDTRNFFLAMDAEAELQKAQLENNYLEKIQLDWYQIYKRCYIEPWSLGVLQPEYVYFINPLVIIDDCNYDQ